MRKNMNSLVAVFALILTTLIPTQSFGAVNQLASPKNITFTNISSTSVTVNWNRVPNASSYKIYLYYATGQSFKSIPTSDSALSFSTGALLSPLTSYRISIQAIATGAFINSPESGKFVVTTGAYAAPKTIATASTIANAATNPSIVVTGVDFRSGITTADLTVGVGTTGLAFNSVTFNNSNQVTLGFAGSSAAGTITITAKTSAFIIAPESNSNSISIVIGSNVSEGNVNCATSGYFTIASSVVTGNTFCVGAAVVPTGVTEINGYAFNANSGLTSITIPTTVTSIGGSAFKNATSLTTVTFESGSQLQEIRQGVFEGASALKSITIPASVTSIGGYVFYNATSLTTVTFESGSQLDEIRQGLFQGASTLTSITIPASVTSIGGYAFEGASALTSITIPASVTSIGGYAFYNATSLTTVTFESGSQLQEIMQGVFEGASALTLITIPAGVTYMGGYVFYNSRSLSAIYFLGNAPSVGSNPFLGVASGASVYITNTATGFGALGSNWNGLIVTSWI